MLEPIYKPNPKNTGMALSLNIAKDEKYGKPILWATMTRQVSWDGNAKKGVFKANLKDPEKSINVKFTKTEAEGIAGALLNQCADWPENTLEFYHKNPSGYVSIKMAYSEKEYKGKVTKGYYLTFNRDGNDTFGIGILKATEAYEASHYITNILGSITVDSFWGWEDNKETKTTAEAVKTVPKESKAKPEDLEDSPF